MCANATPAELAAALRGARLSAVRRKGKWLILDLADSSRGSTALLAHFGMTGRFSFAGVPAPKYETSSDVDPAVWPPRFAILQLEFGEGERETLFIY